MSLELNCNLIYKELQSSYKSVEYGLIVEICFTVVKGSFENIKVSLFITRLKSITWYITSKKITF